MARMTPETRTHVEGFKAVKVKHPRLEEVDQQVTQAIDEHTGYTHLLLYGPSGVGKSTVIRRIAERFCAEEPHQARVPVVLIEARPSDTGTYVRLDYYRQVLLALKAHVVVKERLVNITTSTKPTCVSRHVTEWLDLREAVEQALERLHVKAVVIDEAQHLMQVAAPHKLGDQLDWLKSMTNRTNVRHVLVGTYDLFDFRNLHGQAARRGRDIHFPRYHVDTATERQEFVGALRYLLEHVPLPCDVRVLLAHWRWFADCSVGCVGILKDWLVQTVAATLGEAGAPLTLEALTRHALQPAPRIRLEVEARAGEHKVELGNATSHEQLQALLGSPSSPWSAHPQPPAPHAPPVPGAPSVPSPDERPPDTARRRGRVGMRAPARDPVGGAAPAALPPKCAFAGAVDMDPMRLRHTETRAIECPVCGAVRTVLLQGDVGRFPTHPPLRTRTTKDVTRWVRQGTVWTLWEKPGEGDRHERMPSPEDTRRRRRLQAG
jgi:AAA domain-containing protein